MIVSVRLFAILREHTGSDRVELELPDGATVADALKALSQRPSLVGVLERLPVQMAVNRDYASIHTRLASDDELALIPPLSGGAPAAAARVRVAVTDAPLSLQELSRWVSDPRAGAIATFQGTTREVAHLEYEAYREMAEDRITMIVDECCQRHHLCAAAAEHRIGSVALGEPSVIVAVSAPHRGQAFAGAREIIDRLKAQAPIWKREVDTDGGARDAQGTPAPGAMTVASEIPGPVTTDGQG